MKRSSGYIAAIAVLCLVLNYCTPGKRVKVVIVCSNDVSSIQKLAVKEIKRYIYLRTSETSFISTTDTIPGKVENLIFLGTYRQLKKEKNLPAIINFKDESNLKEQQYVIKSFTDGGSKYLVVLGGGEIGCLYGAYKLAELLGVRFYLHGDVIPDQQVAFNLPQVDIHANPLFELRGIQPFHDFPEGPDWWNLNEYKSVLSQLPKMGMNFFGLHTYPEGGPNAEPTVWIGRKSEFDDKGKVLKSYPSSYQSTQRGNWGFAPENTSSYHFGAALLYESDTFASDVMIGTIPSPNSDIDCNLLFNRTGEMLCKAFKFGHYLGIKTCVGTETPLVVPNRVRKRLIKEGKDPSRSDVISSLYEGIFERIKRTYPIDYYWLWTPEGWTWDSVPSQVVKRTEQDLLIAIRAAKNVKTPFTVATCGWVLGPPSDRKQFDKNLPKEIPFSCINRYVGFSPVEKAFEEIHGRSKWAIPWMEDDPGLIYPQLWAGRMRRDAMDALKYGCNGLFGIHWRTQIIGPNVSALAKAAWNKDEWKSPGLMDTVRDLPVTDFYEDWAEANFGKEVSHQMAAIFITLDGSAPYKPELKKDYEAKLFRPVTWINGPGGIKINKTDWKIIEKKYSFIKEYEMLGKILKGPGNRERFDYWLNYFKYSRSIAHLGCVLGELDSVVQSSYKLSDRSQRRLLINEKAIPLRIHAASLWGELETYLLSAITSSGEIGTITNLEQHNLLQMKLLNHYDSLLISVSEKPLPEKCILGHQYLGPERLIMPCYRSLLEQNEDLNLKILILSNEKSTKAMLHWRKMGAGKYMDIEIKNQARAVYSVTIPSSAVERSDIEYYITADMPSGKTLKLPATAPQINYTAVVIPDALK